MRKPPSLFWRVFLTVLLATFGVLSVFAVLFYADRNRAIAELSAELMAPALRQAAGLPLQAVPLAARYRADERPALAVDASTGVPRFRVLVQQLRTQGIEVQEMVYTREDGALVLWLKLTDAGGRQRWLGFGDRVLEPTFPRRALAGWALAMALLMGASAALAWHLSRPLGVLQKRIESAFAPGWERSGMVLAAHAGRRRWGGPTREVLAIEHSFERLCTQLSRQERERELLLAGVSHDLRSPLARIRTAAELLPDQPGVAVRQVSIVRNVEVADRLIGALLDQVRLGLVPIDQPVDIGAVARGVIAYRTDAGAELETDLADGVVLQGAHPLQIERLLSNLIDNALQHGSAPVHLSVQAEPGMACISVTDHGAGFDPAAWDQMVQAFARGDHARRQAGVGLGLTIVKQVVDRLGGRVTVRREPARFEIRLQLPLVPAAR